MKHRQLVVKDNALINASYNLDLVEQRLILLAIVEARENGQGINTTEPLVIHADTYAHQFGVHRNTAYEALQKACDQLFERGFSYQESLKKGVAHIRSRWVSQIAYLPSTASVQLIFSPAVVPMITALEKHFTSYELEQVSELRSAYAVRLYEILIAWRSVGQTPIISLEDFRAKLGVEPHKYQRMHHFKAKVLDAAIEQINLHTDIFATYEQQKNGRSISGFKFSFRMKKAPPKTAINGFSTINKLSEKQISYFSDLLSRAPEMAKYSKAGWDYKEFARWIEAELSKEERLKEWRSILEKVGLKA